MDETDIYIAKRYKQYRYIKRDEKNNKILTATDYIKWCLTFSSLCIIIYYFYLQK